MIYGANEAFIARLWVPGTATPIQRSARAGDVPVNLDEVYERHARVANLVAANDARTHLDLAIAYGEMGLSFDAIRSAANALHERAPLSVASRALDWLFGPARARPGTLRALIDGARTA